MPNPDDTTLTGSNEQVGHDLPRTMEAGTLDFYLQIHNPNTLLYRVYTSSLTMHFFREVLDEVRAFQNQQQAVNQEQRHEFLKLLKLINQPSQTHQKLQADETDNDFDGEADIKVKDDGKDSPLSDDNSGNNIVAHCRNTWAALQNRCGDEGLDELKLRGKGKNEKDEETIRKLLSYQITPTQAFGDDSEILKEMQNAAKSLHQIFVKANPEYAAASKAGSFVASYIKDFAMPAALAAMHVAGDTLEDAAKNLEKMLPTWTKQANQIEQHQQSQEKMIEKAANQASHKVQNDSNVPLPKARL